MNKFVKALLITLAVIACIVLIPPMILKSRIDGLADTKKAENITDTSLAFESTYEIKEGDITMQVPTYYASTKLSKFSAVMCASQQQQKELMIIYYPFGPVADTIMPGYSDQLDRMFDEYENAKPGPPWNMFVEVPEDVFEVMREVCLADKNTFDFWNFKHSLSLYYYLAARQHVAETQSDFSFSGIYERDDIRAVSVQDLTNKDTYVVMIFPKNDPETIYAFVISTKDMDDITKLLNTFDYNSLF